MHAKLKKIKRYKAYGVGQYSGSHLTLHRAYENNLPSNVLQFAKGVAQDFNYTLVRYCQRSKIVTFVECNDFDTATEPTIGATLTVYPTSEVAETRYLDARILLHKWLYVRDTYKGFSSRMAQCRSAYLLQFLDCRKYMSVKYEFDTLLEKYMGSFEEKDLPTKVIKLKPTKIQLSAYEKGILQSMQSGAHLNQGIYEGKKGFELVVNKSDSPALSKVVRVRSNTAESLLQKEVVVKASFTMPSVLYNQVVTSYRLSGRGKELTV